MLQCQTREVFATQSRAKKRLAALRRFYIFSDKSIVFPRKIVVPGEMVVIVAVWRVVSKVGKDNVEYIEGFEGLMHLVLPIRNRREKGRLENGCH